MVKELYTKPETEIEVFEVADIITDSGDTPVATGTTEKWELPEI